MIERAADFASRGVAVGVQHAVAAVRALAGERELGPVGLVELQCPT